MKRFLLLILALICLSLPWFRPATTTSGSRLRWMDSETPVPIVMYHSLLKDPQFQNQFVISPDLLESDLIYLKEHGYTTITMTELINAVKQRTSLPEKPVILTFDDGYYNNYYYGFPLLKKYTSKAVISVVGAYVEQFSLSDSDHPNYSYLTWAELKELQESGFVEIQNHTFDLHSNLGARKGAGRLPGETSKQYRTVLTEDLGKLQTELQSRCGITPNTFTYPFGEVGEGSEDILRDLGFEASLTCYGKTNWISPNGDETQLFQLGRYLRPNDLSSEAFFHRIQLY